MSISAKKILRSDYCVVGGGVIGSSIARALAKKHPQSKILLLEKDNDTFLHNSTKNSAVLHAGMYYKPGSMKAKLCPRGNSMLKAYMKEKGVWFNECGKLILPKHEREDPIVEKIYKQGLANGVRVELVDEQQCKRIEPLARTHPNFQRGIFCPDTAVGDLYGVASALKSDLLKIENVEVMTGAGFDQLIDQDKNKIRFRTSNDDIIETGQLVNSAGYGCLEVANKFGVGTDLEMIYLKGYYLKAARSELRPEDIPKVLIYPIPPTETNIFLGVHTTQMQHYYKLGPTAIPGLSGTHYGLVSKITFDDFIDTTGKYTRILFSKKGLFYIKQFAAEVSSFVYSR